MDFDPKGTISEVRVHAGLYFHVLDSGQSLNAAVSPRSSPAPDRLVYLIKLKLRNRNKAVPKPEKALNVLGDT